MQLDALIDGMHDGSFDIAHVRLNLAGVGFVFAQSKNSGAAAAHENAFASGGLKGVFVFLNDWILGEGGGFHGVGEN